MSNAHKQLKDKYLSALLTISICMVADSNEIP